jgi:2-aminoethylphosphonate-pyruvate transaminase
MKKLSQWKDKALFTPGPLTTSGTVKQSMLRDLGSRDSEFIQIIRDVRHRLVDLAGGNDQHTAILVQGSGTFGIESVLSSIIPPDGKLIILVNGAYGTRMLKIAKIHKINTQEIIYAENTCPDANALDHILANDPAITHVAVVHCETTTGIINPIQTYGEIVHKHKRVYIVDAMSSFGAYPINLQDAHIDYLISSANKCIEGVPGFSFILANKQNLVANGKYARTLSLDLLAQWQGLETDGQFRFTPPTHVILAFHQALLELEQEGGVAERGLRYYNNYQITIEQMQKMGFRPYLEENQRGYIITSFFYPSHLNFHFKDFYERLSEKGHVIYPGKLSHADCFRIGHVGRLNAADVRALMLSIAETLLEMGIELPQA